MKVTQARIIARLAHQGQKYGDRDYFSTHVEDVVRRCESSKHCTVTHVIVAYLHDVLEDTDLSMDDLIQLGLERYAMQALLALTKRDDEDYASYTTRVLENRIATFVKYHDLLSNMDACREVLKGYESPMDRDRAKHLIVRRYSPAMDRIYDASPYWLHESHRK